MSLKGVQHSDGLVELLARAICHNTATKVVHREMSVANDLESLWLRLAMSDLTDDQKELIGHIRSSLKESRQHLVVAGEAVNETQRYLEEAFAFVLTNGVSSRSRIEND